MGKKKFKYHFASLGVDMKEEVKIELEYTSRKEAIRCLNEMSRELQKKNETKN